jgi:hypothetical protein
MDFLPIEIPALGQLKTTDFADTIIRIFVHMMRLFQAISPNIRQHGAQILGFRFRE